MKKKILFCATVDYHFRAFHLPVMQWFQSQGWEVHVAARGDLELPYTDRKFDLPLERSPFKTGNIVAYRKLKALIDNERYSIIHCHTPVGGLLARLAARKARIEGTKVIYTAHGFHFCKGAPLKNWLLYYPVEKRLAALTDCLITINREDYERALKRQFRAGSVSHIHGVGLAMDRYHPISVLEKEQRREQYGYRRNQLLMICTAEFNANKNHQLLLHVMENLKEKLPEAKLLLAGQGELQEACKAQAEQLGISHMVDFLGYRDDLAELLPICDLAVSASLREGLPVNIMEAMASGLPIVATENRGHCELIREGKNGFLLSPRDIDGFAVRIQLLGAFQDSRAHMGQSSVELVKLYALDKVLEELEELYKPYMDERLKGLEQLQWQAL
ncbi:glycosyltransferase family 4 protein [Paenibacillus sp. HB172176]|uniref:glycosyltransferase family 4 protein n=1 Tax=Paenibacillus sp. HB172176 TaxID=2493690 RepID=UPI001439422F|nr:glycosyltransferase family 4 protein [Paenibacillus sp. HB172176]